MIERQMIRMREVRRHKTFFFSLACLLAIMAVGAFFSKQEEALLIYLVLDHIYTRIDQCG